MCAFRVKLAIEGFCYLNLSIMGQFLAGLFGRGRQKGKSTKEGAMKMTNDLVASCQLKPPPTTLTSRSFVLSARERVKQ